MDCAALANNNSVLRLCRYKRRALQVDASDFGYGLDMVVERETVSK